MRSPQKIRRHRFLAGTAIAAGSFATLPGRARAAQFTYRLSTSDSKTFPQTLALIQWSNEVKAQTNGRLQIDIFTDGQLGSVASTITQVRLGSIEMMSNANALFAAVSPVAQVLSIGFSFGSPEQALAALDGPLGNYVRADLASKGLLLFEWTQDSGYREMTTSTKPIQSADDFVGLRMRTQPAPIYVDLFKALGAAPTPIDANELYTALQTRLVDAQENPLVAIEGFRLYEVQKYLSITNHLWAGESVAANPKAIEALPADIRTIMMRSFRKNVMAERRSVAAQQAALVDKLRRQGLAVNTANNSTMRGRLGAYYRHWKTELGPTAWGLLETAAGSKLE